jgi:hypothetical protein
MLIECPECKNAISDKAAACPHCGVALSTLTDQPVKKLGNAKSVQQWARGFFWLFVLCLLAALIDPKEIDPSLQMMATIGLFGWIICKVRLWFYT